MFMRGCSWNQLWKGGKESDRASTDTAGRRVRLWNWNHLSSRSCLAFYTSTLIITRHGLSSGRTCPWKSCSLQLRQSLKVLALKSAWWQFSSTWRAESPFLERDLGGTYLHLCIPHFMQTLRKCYHLRNALMTTLYKITSPFLLSKPSFPLTLLYFHLTCSVFI